MSGRSGAAKRALSKQKNEAAMKGQPKLCFSPPVDILLFYLHPSVAVVLLDWCGCLLTQLTGLACGLEGAGASS